MSSLQSLNADDALKFMIDCLKKNPNGYRGSTTNFGIHMPNVVNEYCAKVVGNNMLAQQEGSDQIYVGFYDAAWQRCRMGILRPSALCPRGQTTADLALGDGYSLTE